MADKIKIVGILQNAWSTYWTDHWPRNFWLEALKRSRTGQRLKHMDHEMLDIWYDETTPKIADNPRTVLPADLDYMRGFLKEQQPKYIITFGMPAMKAMEQLRSEYDQAVLSVPHPTYRVVTNALFIEAREYLVKGFEGWYQFQQGKSGIIISKKNQLYV